MTFVYKLSHCRESRNCNFSFHLPPSQPASQPTVYLLSTYLVTHLPIYISTEHERLRMFLKWVFPFQCPENCDLFCHCSTLELPFGSFIAWSCFSYLWLFASLYYLFWSSETMLIFIDSNKFKIDILDSKTLKSPNTCDYNKISHENPSKFLKNMANLKYIFILWN